MRNCRGMILPGTLAVVVILLVILSAAVSTAVGSVRAAAFWRDWTHAVHAAESGIEEALYRLRHGATAVPVRTYPDDEPSFCSPAGLLADGASYMVWVGPDPLTGRGRAVTSVGRLRQAERTVSAGCSLPSGCLFPRDIVQTGGTPEIIIEMPPGLGPGTELRIVRDNVQLNPGDCWYTGIWLTDRGSLVLSDRVNMFLTGDVSMSGAGTLNTSQQATRLIIFVPHPHAVTIDFSGTGAVYAGIYAPLSRITVRGSVTVVGSLVGAEVVVKGTADVIYDPALANIGPPAGYSVGGAWQFTPGSWRDGP